MTRKLLGILTAVALAAVGTVALVAYVQSAEDRALADETLVEVYVVEQTIPLGTPGAQLANFVSIKSVPAKTQAQGALSDLAEVADMVTAVELIPGEQLISGRFMNAAAFNQRSAGVEVPDGMVEITIEVEPEQAVGGLLRPGQEVVVIVSLDPFTVESSVVEVDGEGVGLPSAVAAEVDGKTPNITDTLFPRALVTAVQEDEGGGFESSSERASARVEQSPSNQLLVTLAVLPSGAEQLVFAAEYGRIWLALTQESVSDTEDAPVVYGSVFEGAGS